MVVFVVEVLKKALLEKNEEHAWAMFNWLYQVFDTHEELFIWPVGRIVCVLKPLSFVCHCRENRLNWDQEIRDDVIEECNKHGGVLHIYVDKSSPQGNVYVKCPTIAAAVASVNSLHGRYFGGKSSVDETT